MPDFKIRLYQKGDEVNINNAFNEVFEQNRSMEEWYWKFDPENDGSIIILAVDDDSGEILAHFAGIKVPLQINGQVDTYIHSLDSFSIKSREVLRKKIFLKTYEEYCNKFGGMSPEKFRWHYGSNGGRIMKLGQLRLQYTTPIPIIYLFKDTKRYQRALGKFIRKWVWEWYIKQRPFELEEIDDLWNRSSHRYELSVVKNGNYINKRYLKHPSIDYAYITVKRKGILRALAVLKYGAGRLQWVELIWDGQESEALKALERRVWFLALQLGAIRVEMWLNNDEVAKDVLLSQGMNTKENPYDLFVSSRSFDPDFDGEDITKRLYFTMGDSDIF